MNYTKRMGMVCGLASTVCIGLAGIPQTAHAQTGMRIIQEAWDPITRELTPITGFSKAHHLDEGMQGAWDKARPDVEKKLIEKLGKGGFLGGETAYDIELALAQKGDLRVRVEDDHLVLGLMLRGNTATFKTTQPTPLGKYADPKLGASFDIEMEAVIDVPAYTAPLRLAQDKTGKSLVSIKITNGKLTTQNLIADATKALVDFVSSISQLFGGPNFWSEIEGMLNRDISLASSVDPMLAVANQTLTSLRDQNYTILQLAQSLVAAKTPRQVRVASIAQDAPPRENVQYVTLRAYRDKYDVPTVGSGLLRGVIRWNKELGKPLTAQPFVFGARVQSGPGQVGTLGVPTTDITRPVYGEIVATDTGYEMHYEVYNLPNDIQMDIATIGLAKDATWPGFQVSPTLQHVPVPPPAPSPQRPIRIRKVGAARVSINPQPLPPKIPSVMSDGWQGSLRIRRPFTDIEKRLFRNAQILPQRTNPEGHGVLNNINYTLTAIDKPVIR